MGFDTEREGGFYASPGWAALLAASDRLIDEHERTAGRPARVTVKSKGGIDYGQACCEALDDALLEIERASARTCQACGAPGEWHGYLVECAEHAGRWPYGADDPSSAARPQ